MPPKPYETRPRMDEREAPEICTRCDYYKPKFWRVQQKECAAFGTVDGVRDNRCGMFSRRSETDENRPG